jgi:transposase
MGPESAKSYPGVRLVHAAAAMAPSAPVSPPALAEPAPPASEAGVGGELAANSVQPTCQPAERAKQEIDYGRRGKGYIFGALQPATGDALTAAYDRRTTANFVDFMEKVALWLAPASERVYVILDNLAAHRATDVLLFALAHPCWEFVFQPKYAAYLNLIEPWWKVLRSLALKGRRFETWAEVCQAIEEATNYWNHHRHPFIWGRRRRHQPRRASGVALLPKAA